MTLVSIVNQILSVLTVLAQIFAVVVLLSWLLKKENVLKFLSGNVLTFTFIISLIATMGSLFYSEIAGYEPCKLCWYQRILMYPQVLILGMALWRKDFGIVAYGFLLSVLGFIVAFYHYLLQLGIAPDLGCDAVGYSVSCAQRFVMNFGYITIPLMAASAFLLMSLLFLVSKKYINQR